MTKIYSRLLQLIVVLVLSQAWCVNQANAQGVKLTTLKPAFYTQGGRTLTKTGDPNGWSPQILDRKFTSGVNTFANSEIIYILNGKYKTFSTWVGIESKAAISAKDKVTYDDQDDASNKEHPVKGKVIFRVFGDGNMLFDSGIMDEFSKAKEVKVDVSSIKELELIVLDAEAGGDPNHSTNTSKINWADPVLTLNNVTSLSNDKTTYRVVSGNSVLSLNGQGKIVAYSHNGKSVAIQGTTKLVQSSEDKPAIIKTMPGGGIQVTRSLKNNNGNSATMTEWFTPGNGSINWKVDILSNDKSWNAAIVSSLKYPVSSNTKFWTTWSNPDLIGQGGWTNSVLKTQWRDPLQTRPFTNSSRWFGGNPMMYVPTSGDIFSVPIATVVDAVGKHGFSLVQSPQDTLLYLKLITTADGSIEFQRRYHRLGNGQHVRFSLDLVNHEDDWRGGLSWMVNRYPKFFEPENSLANKIGGSAAYSSWEGPLDAPKLKKMGFTYNWKASFDFPYMGMYLPPAETWQTFATSAESAKDPWAKTPYKGAPTSRTQLENYSKLMRSYDFYVLNYFNVTEFGKDVQDNWTVDKNIKESDLWKDCNNFLHAKIADGILYNENTGKDYYRTWGKAVVMDPGATNYRNFLIKQTQNHIDYLPSSSGICIDRMDWLRYFNTKADDGISWYNNKPARSLFTSWKSLLDSMGQIMHKNNKVIFANPMVSMRIDMMEHIDGFYSEHNEFGNGLNSSVMLGLRKPLTAWAWDDESLKPDPDQHFQQYLYLGVFPTSPVPDNNHEIRPSEFADNWYLKYGPLFKSIAGRKWALTSNVASVPSGGAKVNVFEVPGGFSMPIVMAARNMKTIEVVIAMNKLTGTGNFRAEAILPGSEVPVQLTKTIDKTGQLRLNVPLKDGCAVVNIVTL